MTEQEEYQNVILTFDNGEKAIFTGKVAVRPGDTRKIIGIAFGTPKALPQGMSWEPKPLSTKP